MRVLVLGAGAVGGYYGGRLLEAGRDVTFLVHVRRAVQLGETGLTIHSRRGEVQLKPRLVSAGHLHETFGLVMVACRAYDLAGALQVIAPAIGRKTLILPVLDGLAHYDALDARFGPQRTLGGLCSIAVSRDAEGAIHHHGLEHLLRFGERGGGRSTRVDALEKLFEGVNLDAAASADIMQPVWEKWMVLACLAGMTCLMRASIPDILEAGPRGQRLLLQLLDECVAIATACCRAPQPEVLEGARHLLCDASRPYCASMLRSLEAGLPIESDQIIGDLLERGEKAGVAAPLLEMAYCHLKAYEARRVRDGKPSERSDVWL